MKERDKSSEAWRNIFKERQEKKPIKEAIDKSLEVVEKGFIPEELMFELWSRYITSKEMLTVIGKETEEYAWHLGCYTFLRPLFEEVDDY